MPNICLYFALFPTVLSLYDILWACGNMTLPTILL